VTEPETIALLINLLAEGDPFCHVRFGDGDVFFATGTGPKLTADGEEWTRGLQWQLLNAWERLCITRHRLLVGDVESYIADDGCGHQWSVLREYGGWRRGEPLELVHIEALRCGLGFALPLYLAIANDPRPKFYVAPERLAPAARMLNAEHVVVPLRTAWQDYVFEHAPSTRYSHDAIILLSCGRAGKIIQGQLCHGGHPFVQIDIGSGLDLLFTDLRRSTDLGLKVEPLRAFYREAGLEL
jgi:hypothetical protein